MSDTRLAAFSNTGRFYAYVCDDGKLRIWEVISGILKQEFTPDLHLRSPYTRLCWINSSKKVLMSMTTRQRVQRAFVSIMNVLLFQLSGPFFDQQSKTQIKRRVRRSGKRISPSRIENRRRIFI